MNTSRLTFRRTAIVALQQITLAALLFLLIAGWLHIPDANVFEVLISIVFALLIAGIAGVGQSLIALRLTSRPATVRRVLLGMAAFVLAVLLWYGVSFGVGHFIEKAGLWAGYLNSRFPASLRHVLSFQHLLLCFLWIGGGVKWIAAGLLAAVVFAVVTCTIPVRGFWAILCTADYWLSLLLFVVVGAVLTGALMGWTPGHGLRVEVLSLVARMLLVIVLNAATIALLLQAMARAVVGIQSVGTDAPVTSQPRTAEMP
ncbi:hypothetical protein [Terriglobus sp. RCC_193]|uniref:hypothetical protein n=1 Tax=Terriglobus sp. RCC_193 TaxID=3239218 RepID=UPI0035250BA1